MYSKLFSQMSCMSVNSIHLAGGWSLLNGHKRSHWSMNDVNFLLEKTLGSPAFFTVDIAIDDKNSSQYILEVCITAHVCCCCLTVDC